MLKGIHFLLSYACNMECDHCFLFCSPYSKGTMTIAQIREVLDEAQKLGSVEDIYFEGGEPFMFYPLMLEGIRLAKAKGFRTGIVSNGYWSTTEEDARLWLEPLAQTGIDDLAVSVDELHYSDAAHSPAAIALKAADALGMPTYSLCKERPEVKAPADPGQEKGAPEIAGGIKLRGRAVEKFAAGLPTRPSAEFTECPYEDLLDPKRVHLDAYGLVHICQGVIMGNCWQTPLAELVRAYRADPHPICGPLAKGGPLALAREYGLKLPDEFVDECHMCYQARRALLERFPQCLGPRQVYGLEEE
jgi:hypothetical protein